MDRRSFFKFGLDKGVELAKNVASLGLKMKFRREMIRPPGAIPEEKFLLTCTRCGDCQSACPHEAIHLVNAVSPQAKTPFIDPYFKACQYCEDMPCVKVCQPQALRWNSNKTLKLALASLNKIHCLVFQGQYCDYCFNSCPEGIDAISKDEQGLLKIDASKCVGCGKCAYICVSQTGRAIEMKAL